MNEFTLRVAAATLLGLAGLTSGAAAQEPECACRAAPGAVGSILSSKGDVMVAQSAAYAPAGKGQTIGAGSRVMVGAQSQAQIKLGACSLTLAPNTTTEILNTNGALCVATSNAVPDTTAAGLAKDGSFGVTDGKLDSSDLLVMGFTAGGIALVAATNDSDDDDDNGGSVSLQD